MLVVDSAWITIFLSKSLLALHIDQLDLLHLLPALFPATHPCCRSVIAIHISTRQHDCGKFRRDPHWRLYSCIPHVLCTYWGPVSSFPSRRPNVSCMGARNTIVTCLHHTYSPSTSRCYRLVQFLASKCGNCSGYPDAAAATTSGA